MPFREENITCQLVQLAPQQGHTEPVNGVL